MANPMCKLLLRNTHQSHCFPLLELAVEHDIDNYRGGSEEDKYEQDGENYPASSLRGYGNSCQAENHSHNHSQRNNRESQTLTGS